MLNLALMLTLLAAGQQEPRPPALTGLSAERVYSAREAVLAAADLAPSTVAGTFALRVVAAGRETDRVYLNSEFDYRDQRNLTINIAPPIVRELTERFGSPPEEYFRGRVITVRGEARRIQIDFIGDQDRRSGLYYYQTHVLVTSVGQIAVVDYLPAPSR
jgi:hypothetical protein